MTKDEALKLALEALEHGLVNTTPVLNYDGRIISKAIAAIRKALADSALDRMAENARELGLDYEPIVEQVEDSVGMGHGAWDMVEPKKLAKAFHEALAEQPAQQQEPVALDPKDVHVEVVTKQMGGFAPVMTNGIRLTHKPTGIVVEETAERSAHRNRDVAWKKLAKLVASPPVSKPWVGLTHEDTYEATGTASTDLLDLAKLWSDNKVHVYQFDNEARKIIEAVLRRASAKLREKNA